jgi:CHAD domain-containing protein
MTDHSDSNLIRQEISFRDNARDVLSDVLEAFYSHAPHDSADSEALHELRIAAKRLRYSMEFFESCYGKRLNNYIESIKELQELLGNIHDCDVMIELVQKRIKKASGSDLPAETASGFNEIIIDYERERAQLVETFTVLWSRKFNRGFKTRLLKVLAADGGREEE